MRLVLWCGNYTDQLQNLLKIKEKNIRSEPVVFMINIIYST